MKPIYKVTLLNMLFYYCQSMQEEMIDGCDRLLF